MMQFRRSSTRGRVDYGWLRCHHSFSFAEFHDPLWMCWGNLRAINEDRIAPGTGFDTHSHRDVEIISYVVKGRLAHRDSLGNVHDVDPGKVQRLSAGTGVRHSEFNHDYVTRTHFLQIWLEPDRRGLAPSYEIQSVDVSGKRGQLRLLAAPGGERGALTVHADARVHAGLFDGDERARLSLASGRKGYVHLVRGDLIVNGHHLGAGDALAIENESLIEVWSGKDAEVLVFDLRA
ncbi:MAG: pirin family protein [Burkholderiaceae bacterium]